MKGVVFTEFLEMVGAKFGEDMVDDIIDDSDLPSGGAYTAVGTYPHTEMVSLAVALSERSKIALPELLKVFGAHLFGRFTVGYPSFFEKPSNSFELLSGIEDVIHAEVIKLYPDADLPTFEVEHHDPQKLVLIYKSVRHFEDLAEGLIVACLDFYGEKATLKRETVGEGANRSERFILNRA